MQLHYHCDYLHKLTEGKGIITCTVWAEWNARKKQHKLLKGKFKRVLGQERTSSSSYVLVQYLA